MGFCGFNRNPLSNPEETFSQFTVYIRCSWTQVATFIKFLRRNLRNCPKNLKELGYKQFVLPVLEYAATICDPYHQNDINKIEMIQYNTEQPVLC